MLGLVASGGAKKGAFELGCMEILIGDKGRQYDFMGGTSVGCLNTGILCQYPKEEIRTGLNHLVEVWESITGNKSIWKPWFLGKLAGFWKDSFFDSHPLTELIRANFDQDRAVGSDVKFVFGAVAYGSGEYYEATKKDEELWKWIVASSAFPGFLTPIMIGDDLWIDGGVRRITPLKSAIEAGCTEIDVLLGSPRATTKKDIRDNWLGTKRSAITILIRSLDLVIQEIFVRDIKICEMYNKLVDANHEETCATKKKIKLNIYEPDEPLDTGMENSLTFDPKDIERMRMHGRDVASR
jgi:predicted acylesterase/phospholipase RssA